MRNNDLFSLNSRFQISKYFHQQESVHKTQRNLLTILYHIIRTIFRPSNILIISTLIADREEEFSHCIFRIKSFRVFEKKQLR